MATVTISLRNLFRQVSKRIPHAELLQRSGITTTRNPSKYVSQAINDNDTIPFSLADFVLQETLFSGDPIENVMSQLRACGLSPEQIKNVRGHIENLVTRMPIGTSIAKDKDTGIKRYDPPPAAVSEAPAPYTKPEARHKVINRRDELERYTLEQADAENVVPIPKWLNLACGEGADLELCEDFLYVRKLPDWKHVHSAVLRGDSMQETLRPGDIILMREHPFELQPIQDKEEKTPLPKWEAQSGIKHDDICVLTINGGPHTLKRVVYDTRHGRNRWKMLICAENPPAWGRDFPVETGDHIIFYAKLIGIGDGKYTKR